MTKAPKFSNGSSIGIRAKYFLAVIKS